MNQEWVFLHGALGIGSLWNPVISLLTDKEILSPDLPGHGTTYQKHAMNIPAYSEYIWEKIRHLNNPILVGHSMGGYIGIYLHALNPGFFKGIITLGSILTWNDEILQRELNLCDSDTLKTKVPEFCKTLNERHSDWESLVNRVRTCMQDIQKNQYLDRSFHKEEAQKICLSIGDKDKNAGLQNTLNFHNRLPGSHFMVLPNTPHPLEKVNPQLLSENLKYIQTVFNRQLK